MDILVSESCFVAGVGGCKDVLSFGEDEPIWMNTARLNIAYIKVPHREVKVIYPSKTEQSHAKRKGNSDLG